eukprot:PLAT10071.2.p1 GENE.PLAT10071.2~~PLAT10071.2.p1  ORF type:complete len:670 (-),score=206.73 PLAT10071.2:72-2081(-)
MRLAVLVLLAVAWPAAASCPRQCSGHGFCSGSTCTCFNGWTAADCSQRTCPTGIAWSDVATGNDDAHNSAECSNMGLCDRTTGLCSCRSGWEGSACDRMSCVRDSSGNLCSGHGECFSMASAAAERDDVRLLVSTSYSLWDANLVQGCVCDAGWQGYDCSLRACASGDDPQTTGQLDEIQELTCSCPVTCSGSFTLSFRGRQTAAIQYNANAAAVEAALEALSTIEDVTVTNGDGSVCTAGGSTTVVTFTHNPGNLPAMTLSSAVFSSGGAVSMAINDGGAGGSVDGTREDDECNGRGLCDRSTGLCSCFTGFASSNGAGASGQLGDCGYVTSAPTACYNDCSGHGTCDGNFVCTCSAGYTGADCSLRACGTAAAWFDEASAADTAHAAAECSNMGHCDRSLARCTCRTGFEGDDCELLQCSSSTCSGRGSCLTMSALAAEAEDNGDSTPYTYTLWDAGKVQGCHCDTQIFVGRWGDAFADARGYDCSELECQKGDDPSTTGVAEQQTIACNAAGGTFTITFRQQTTAAIAYNEADASVIQTAINALSSIKGRYGTVAVSFTGGKSNACDNTGVITVVFSTELGDLPAMTVNTGSLTTPTVAVSETVPGTKEAAQCSNKGHCDYSTGRCACSGTWGSSDGQGSYGQRGDCSYSSSAYLKSSNGYCCGGT